LGILKKLVSALALTSLAFGSGLCFNPYNHNYGFIFKGLGLGLGNKTIVLHNGKMQLGKHTRIKLVKYTVNGNKALMLMRGMGMYFVVYAKCIHGKPVTKDAEVIGSDLGVPSASVQVVNLPKYPIKFGFYKDGFWTKGLVISWIQHLEGNGHGGYACDYQTNYYPYKLINEHKTYDVPSKDQDLPTWLCQTLGKKYGP
jgi:hypothetical protein